MSKPPDSTPSDTADKSQPGEVSSVSRTEAGSGNLMARGARFWLMQQQLAAAKEQVQRVSAEAQLALGRAETALASGEGLFSGGPLGGSEDVASASLLFRDGLGWAAVAIRGWNEPDRPAKIVPYEQAWEILASDPISPLSHMAETESAVLRRAFVQQPILEVRALGTSRGVEDAQALHRALKRCTSVLRTNLSAVQRVRQALLLRWGALFVLVGAVVVVGLSTRKEPPPSNLALNRPTSASSHWANYTSTSGVVDGVKTGIGFHTNLENRPWLQIDLGETRQIHEIEVYNRDDCCHARAVPLVITISLDGTHYQEIARRNEAFAIWNASFEPIRGRYVRLYVDARTYFHLAEVVVR